ncbi:MAG: ATP-binding protein [Bacteroidales bacterium]|nr:ATP-binding protein [Bacteroidales bacterium]
MEKRLNIISQIDNINEVEKFVDEFSEENEIHSDIYGKVLIATVEAVNNSIVHGNKEDVNKKVFLSFQMDQDSIRILVEDEGEGFDYTHLPDPTKPENIENIHGRGIYLMQHLADKVEFFKDGKLVQMSFNL